jgi:membrane-associated phospholipid phosphatase
MRFHSAAAIVVAVSLASCAPAPAADPGLPAVWARTWYGAIRVERLAPPVASRLVAYAATGLYAGLAAADPALPVLTGALNGIPELPRAAKRGDVDPTITAAAAVRVIMDSLLLEALPTTRASLARLADSLVASRMTAGVGGSHRDRSIEIGRQVGLAIVEWSRTDGFTATRGRPYKALVGPGLWINDSPVSTYSTQSISGVSEQVTPDNPANQMRSGGAGNSSDRGLILSRAKPSDVRTLLPVNMAGASEPYWHEVRPFAIERWDSCPIAEPPPYSTSPASALYKNAKAVMDTKASLTDAERDIAYYWADNAGESGTPVGHWLSIASQMIAERGLAADAGSHLLMATAVSQADAFIASWGYKYKFSLLRPRTYIRRVLDPAWEPLIPTPPFPEYPSGHSTQSAAAAVTIAAFIPDGPFTDSTSVSLGHTARQYEAFLDAAVEAGRSRIYGGIHYPVGDSSGRALGVCIGEQVATRLPRIGAGAP